MKANLIFILIAIILFGCRTNNESDYCFLPSNFNEQARNAYIEGVGLYETGRMTPVEKCILENAVSNYLDSLNDWRLTVVDSFRIRTFDLADLGTQFSFVANPRGKFYFFFLPRLREYLVHDLVSDRLYDYAQNGEIILKDSVDLSVANINSASFEMFIRENISGKGSYGNQIRLLDRLLPQIFPFLDHEVLIPKLNEGLESEPEGNRLYIQNFLKPIFDQKALVEESRPNYRIYELEPFGWIVVNYVVDDPRNRSIGVDLFFVAHKRSLPVHYETEIHRYRSCFK